jgi:predicted transcriptional regulator of viral defense system
MKRSLSGTEAKLILQMEWDGVKTVSLSDVQKIMGSSPGYARKLVHGLKKKGWLERIHAGYYRLVGAERGIAPVVPDMNPYVVARVIGEEYYFSFRIACKYHGLTSQQPYVVHIAIKKQRSPIQFKNMEFQFVKLAEGRFFGWESVTLHGEKVNMADLEKTILDCLSRPDLCGGIEEVVGAIQRASRKLDWKRLTDYLEEMSKSSTLAMRLGYLLDRLETDCPAGFEEYLQGRVKKDKALLASKKRFGEAGELDRKWNIVVNISEGELMSEVIGR